MRGLEPPRVAPHDPKSCASASSATSALFFNDLQGRSKSDITFDQFFHHFWVIFSVQKHTTLNAIFNATDFTSRQSQRAMRHEFPNSN